MKQIMFKLFTFFKRLFHRKKESHTEQKIIASGDDNVNIIIVIQKQ